MIQNRSTLIPSWLSHFPHISVMNRVWTSFDPQVVVCQCGADALSGDPHGAFNLTEQAYVKSILYVKEWGLPLLLTGGGGLGIDQVSVSEKSPVPNKPNYCAVSSSFLVGGYNMVNTARCWTAITGCLLNEELSPDIPEHQVLSASFLAV